MRSDHRSSELSLMFAVTPPSGELDSFAFVAASAQGDEIRYGQGGDNDPEQKAGIIARSAPEAQKRHQNGRNQKCCKPNGECVQFHRRHPNSHVAAVVKCLADVRGRRVGRVTSSPSVDRFGFQVRRIRCPDMVKTGARSMRSWKNAKTRTFAEGGRCLTSFWGGRAVGRFPHE